MLWGAFNNASSAMQVFTTDLGSISQNIANVNTNGYKRQEMMFSTLMSEHKATPTSYLSGLNVFGVQATQRNLIQAQGVITPSTTWSDLAINGNGFFMIGMPQAGTATTSSAATASTSLTGAGVTNVPTTISTDDPNSVMYTRDGAWHRAYGADTDPTLARSYFLNNSGGYLLGWMADDTGAIPSDATLQPVYTLAPRPIADNGTAAVNQTSTQTPTSVTMPGRATTLSTILANLPRDAQMGGNQTSLVVKDALGNDQTLTLDWTRTGAYTYTVNASTPNATMDVSTWNVTIDDTGAVTSPSTAQPVTFTWGNGTTTDNVSLATAPKLGTTYSVPVSVYDNNYTQHTVNLRMERSGTNSWYMMPDSTNGTISPSSVNLQFDSSGKLITPANGQAALSFSWAASGTTPAGTASVSVDISKMTQYASSDIDIKNVSQDGYARGNLLATTFSETGELNGYFDNGESRTLFKVPVANFIAANQLEAVSGTMFRRTSQAGDLTVSAVENAPGEARFATSSLEGSTVDIEDEFTRMIMTQKAYSMNSQVFKTADEMTTVARDIKS